MIKQYRCPYDDLTVAALLAPGGAYSVGVKSIELKPNRERMDVEFTHVYVHGNNVTQHFVVDRG